VRETVEVASVADRRSLGAAPDARAAAFTRLAEAHLDASYRLARAILRDPVEAQDATHDAYVQAWRKWSTLRDQDRFEAWFDRILVNTCRNRLQRTTRWQAKDISTEVVIASGDPYRQTLDRDVIGVALRTLSVDHQIVVALRFSSTCPSTRSPLGWAFRRARCSRVFTTRSTACSPRSTAAIARGHDDDRPIDPTPAVFLVRRTGPGE
jgi:RNA polymerase sigma factor (sigma-70 family)